MEEFLTTKAATKKVGKKQYNKDVQTIRITRTLIRDNTHDLNDTRGHSFY